MSKGAPKGHPKWGGRQKGSKNIDRPFLLETARALGADPFEIMILFAAGNYEKLQIRRDQLTPALRLLAAKEAAKYCYQQLKAVEHTGHVDVSPVIREESLEGRIKKIKGE